MIVDCNNARLLAVSFHSERPNQIARHKIASRFSLPLVSRIKVSASTDLLNPYPAHFATSSNNSVARASSQLPIRTQPATNFARSFAMTSGFFCPSPCAKCRLDRACSPRAGGGHDLLLVAIDQRSPYHVTVIRVDRQIVDSARAARSHGQDAAPRRRGHEIAIVSADAPQRLLRDKALLFQRSCRRSSLLGMNDRSGLGTYPPNISP